MAAGQRSSDLDTSRMTLEASIRPLLSVLVWTSYSVAYYRSVFYSLPIPQTLLSLSAFTAPDTAERPDFRSPLSRLPKEILTLVLVDRMFRLSRAALKPRPPSTVSLSGEARRVLVSGDYVEPSPSNQPGWSWNRGSVKY